MSGGYWCKSRIANEKDSAFFASFDKIQTGDINKGAKEVTALATRLAQCLTHENIRKNYNMDIIRGMIDRLDNKLTVDEFKVTWKIRWRSHLGLLSLNFARNRSFLTRQRLST